MTIIGQEDYADAGDLGLGWRMGVRTGSGALSPELCPNDALSGGGDTTHLVGAFFMLCSPLKSFLADVTMITPSNANACA